MNIVYTASSFHPNQAPIMKGWVLDGHKVTFISQYLGPTEDHSYCTPIIIGYSALSNILDKIYAIITRRNSTNSSYPEAFRNKCGFPSYFKLKKLLLEKRPDLVVMRERSVYSMMVYHICKKRGIKCILYNQTPLWDISAPKRDYLHRLVNRLTPSIRITPVYGNPKTGFLDKNATYIPFVIEPCLAPSDKLFFQDGQIHLLCVGKFEPRKNHLMLLKIFSTLVKKYPLKLCIVGEASTPLHQTYLKKVLRFIETRQLQNHVDIHYNCKTSDMSAFYKNADLFVLPSTGEFASISQLEAMSFSVPVIVSEANGTSCYVEHTKNGYLFHDNDAHSLEEQISTAISKPDKLKQMGAYSYELVLEKYCFACYKQQLLRL